jgi:CRP-like cAMP-binding protein
MKVLNPEQLQKLNGSSFLVNHRKGEYVFYQDKPVSHMMFLKSGLTKIFKEGPKNKSTILRIVGPGQYVGLFSVFYDSLYQFSAVALEDSEIYYIPLPLINELITENGQFAFHFIQELGKDGMEIMNKLIFFPQKQVPGRIAEILLFFASQIYKADSYTLPLSRQELADLAYSTKESISRTLTEFKNDRMIEINDRQVELRSVDLLKILSKLG